MEEKKRYSIIEFAGYGCVEIATTNHFCEAQAIARRHNAVIHNNDTGTTMDKDGCLIA